MLPSPLLCFSPSPHPLPSPANQVVCFPTFGGLLKALVRVELVSTTCPRGCEHRHAGYLPIATCGVQGDPTIEASPHLAQLSHFGFLLHSNGEEFPPPLFCMVEQSRNLCSARGASTVGASWSPCPAVGAGTQYGSPEPCYTEK